MIDAIQSFFINGHLLKEFNHAFIVLIPKTPSASEFADYRPISLCHLIYKLISKILVNRMRPILKRIIAPTQAAFVPCQWIHENGLLAQELESIAILDHTFIRFTISGGLLL